MKKLKVFPAIAMILFSNPVFPQRYTTKLKRNEFAEGIDLPQENTRMKNFKKAAFAGITIILASGKAPSIISQSSDYIANAFSGESKSPEQEDTTGNIGNLAEAESEAAESTEIASGANGEPEEENLLNIFDEPKKDTVTPNADSNPTFHKSTPGGSVVKRD